MPRECTRCLYDDTIPNITFDDRGQCSYCQVHDQLEARYPTGEEGERRLKELARKIAHEGRHKIGRAHV